MPVVYDLQLRDRGLVVELYSNFTNGTLHVNDNSFSDVFFYIGNDNTGDYCSQLFNAHDYNRSE